MAQEGLLVLSRRIGEKIVIGEGEIEVVVVSIGRDKVRLGFKAPANKRVDRLEVHEKRMRERAENGPTNCKQE